MTSLRVWAFGCSHETRDIKKGRESLADAIRQSENQISGLPDFGGWDIAIDLGDDQGGVNNTPNSKDGGETRRQFGALVSHNREDIYSVGGNHDKECAGEPRGWWLRRFVDPLGENPLISGVVNARRPYPVTGTWERYYFDVGNIRFLMMSDVARQLTNLRGPLGGDPGGTVTQDTFDWWKDQVETLRGTGRVIITCHHYLPKDTTICTGDYEAGEIGADGIYSGIYHGPGLDPKGSGRLHYIDETADAHPFVDHLTNYNGDTDMWWGAHTHAAPGAQVNGRGLRVSKYGCEFINCAGLTKHHASNGSSPRSRVFEFTHSSNEVVMRNWFHTDDRHAPAIGYYGTPVTLTLAKTVSLP